MSFRKTLVAALGALAILAGLGASEAHAAEVIKIGTLAPKQSVWGQVFQVWETAVKKKSGEQLQLQFFYSGQQGDEGAMVGKMKAGQLDGAAITAVGLSKIYKPILALQLPGALTTWDKLEAAQDALKGDFEKGLGDANFKLLGWGHVGRAHLFLKGGSPVVKPADIQKRKPYMWRDDEVSPKFYQAIGGVNPVPLNVPEVLPQLKTGAVDMLNAPALAVEQLQWSGYLDQASNQVTGCAIGALVVTSGRMKSLPGDLRTILTDTGAIAGKALTTKIKAEDEAAFARMTKDDAKMKKFNVDEAAFKEVFKKTRTALGQGVFTPELVKKIEAIGGV
jgi:TRAP-type C4-dicarboxylate transport system substrate-binding protein